MEKKEEVNCCRLCSSEGKSAIERKNAKGGKDRRDKIALDPDNRGEEDSGAPTPYFLEIIK